MISISMPILEDEEKKSVADVLGTGYIAEGVRVKEFESVFSNYCGTKYGVATSSGTTALHLSLLACGIEKGDEVITTPFSFIATANAILYCGAKPIFADIDAQTFNIDPEKIKEKITDRTKAVIVVHLYGHPCEMEPIIKICRDKNIKLIEDACQAHGATLSNKKVGGVGSCGVFSFYPTKNMTTGEGGMLTTNKPEIAENARLLRNHGSKTKYHHDVLGFNYRMTDIAAAIGLVQIKKLDGFNNKRVENAKKISHKLNNINGLITPYVKPDVTHVFNQYTIRITDDFQISRDKLVKKLYKKGIDTGVYYPIPIHKQPFYKNESIGLNKSEVASGEVLSLPVHPGLNEDDLGYICKTIREV
jgi:dTDP-4-amino-4,6-dideoxygalactose transaminase